MPSFLEKRKVVLGCKNILNLYIFIMKVAEELREIVYVETGLTCSAGVAPNRLLAKVYTYANITEMPLSTFSPIYFKESK